MNERSLREITASRTRFVDIPTVYVNINEKQTGEGFKKFNIGLPFYLSTEVESHCRVCAVVDAWRTRFVPEMLRLQEQFEKGEIAFPPPVLPQPLVVRQRDYVIHGLNKRGRTVLDGVVYGLEHRLAWADVVTDTWALIRNNNIQSNLRHPLKRMRDSWSEPWGWVLGKFQFREWWLSPNMDLSWDFDNALVVLDSVRQFDEAPETFKSYEELCRVLKNSAIPEIGPWERHQTIFNVPKDVPTPKTWEEVNGWTP